MSMNSMRLSVRSIIIRPYYRDNDFDVIERLAERGIAALSLEAWDNGYSIVTRYDMIRRVTGRPELFMCPSA